MTTALDQQRPAGFDNLIPEIHLQIPRAELLQGTSGKLKKESGFDGLRVGMIVNSITGQELDPIFTPVYFITRFVEKDNEGNIIFQTFDANDPHVSQNSEWTKGVDGKNIPPKVQPELDIYGFFGDMTDTPLVATFKRTGYRVGAGLLSKAVGLGGALWSHQYSIGSKEGKGASYVFTAVHKGETPKEMQAAAVDWNAKLKSRQGSSEG